MKCNCEFIVEDVNSEDWEQHYNSCTLRLLDRKSNGEFPLSVPKDENGFLQFQNKHLLKLNSDYLYHLDLGTATHDLKALFGDVKFVCMGGTVSRMKALAEIVGNKLGCELSTGCSLHDITASSHRYSMFKVGPVLAINHGVGMSTLSVVLQEVIKLLTYCGAKDPIMFRIGTSGGVGVEPGTVVISEKGYEGLFNDMYTMPILGKMVSMPALLDKRLAQELKSLIKPEDGFNVVIGNTMCSNDFYNGQGRTDGPFCDYEEVDKFDFLNKLYAIGVRNIEMEVTCFAALTHKAGIKAADVCVTLINRLRGDQVSLTKELKAEYEERPMTIVIRYMKQYLKNINKFPYGKY